MTTDILRTVLMRLRWDKQDGFPGVGPDGKYTGHAGFITTDLPQVTPEELDQLMELAGIMPDQIINLGLCKDCLHARPDGTERGYSRPCVMCSRPQHSHFTPVGDLTRTKGSRGGSCTCAKCKNHERQ